MAWLPLCSLKQHVTGTKPWTGLGLPVPVAPTQCRQHVASAVCRDEAHRLQQQLDQHRLAAAEASQHAAGAQHALQEALEEQQSETRAAQAQASRLEAVRLAAYTALPGISLCAGWC